MSKIKLNLDTLKVDSFETAKSNSEKGTVKGFRPSVYNQCISLYQPSCLLTYCFDDTCRTCMETSIC